MNNIIYKKRNLDLNWLNWLFTKVSLILKAMISNIVMGLFSFSVFAIYVFNYENVTNLSEYLEGVSTNDLSILLCHWQIVFSTAYMIVIVFRFELLSMKYSGSVPINELIGGATIAGLACLIRSFDNSNIATLYFYIPLTCVIVCCLLEIGKAVTLHKHKCISAEEN